MKEEATLYGYKIYPYTDNPIELGGCVEVFFDTELLIVEARQKIRIDIGFPDGWMSTKQTRLLIDALERGMQLIADDRRDKLKRELAEMQKKLRPKD